MFSNKVYRLALLGGLLVAQISLALESDREQPIEIESDAAEYRELEGVTTYTGNVRMSQGSILLLAEEISIYVVDGEVNRLIATGESRNERAYYEQVPSPDTEKVVAQSQTIEYLPGDDLIKLTHNASLTQDGATLNGERIAYDVRKHLLRADSQVGSTKERVRVVIPSLKSSN